MLYDDLKAAIGTLQSAVAKAKGTPAERAEVADAVTRLHDEFLAPIDIPGVGPFAEAFIDRNGGAVLGAVTVAALNRAFPPAE